MIMIHLIKYDYDYSMAILYSSLSETLTGLLQYHDRHVCAVYSKPGGTGAKYGPLLSFVRPP